MSAGTLTRAPGDAAIDPMIGDARGGIHGQLLRGGVDKLFVETTHRIRRPEDTLARFRPLMPALGITRLANITGLDHIGIPVVIATRPLSRGLATAQGKGLDLQSAQASALMEAIETWHAERIEPRTRIASQAEIARTERSIDIHRLARRRGRDAGPASMLRWMEAECLRTGRPVWVPVDAVACDFSADVVRHAVFMPTTNGLASGNHVLEATLHGLCELIERDAVTLHLARAPQEQAACRVALETITDARCRSLIDMLQTAGIDLAVWDCTCDLGVPVMSALIVDSAVSPWQWRGPHRGHGCHTSPEIAFIRAVTEAVQSRLTYISGSRDDLFPEHYQLLQSKQLDRLRHTHFSTPPTRPFDATASIDGRSCEADLRDVLRRLATAGLDEVVVADLTRAELQVPVVKVLVPGLENNVHSAAHYVGGERLARATRRKEAA